MAVRQTPHQRQGRRHDRSHVAHMAGSYSAFIAHVAGPSMNSVAHARKGECWESPTSYIAQVLDLTGFHIHVWDFHLSA